MSILLHNCFRRAAVFHDKHWMLRWLNLQLTSFQSESTNIIRKKKHYRLFLFPSVLLSSASHSFFIFFFYTCRLLSFLFFSTYSIREITKQRMVQMATQSSICNSRSELFPRAAWSGRLVCLLCGRVNLKTG